MGAVPDVSAQHVGDDHLGEVDVGDGVKASIIEVFRETRVPATRNQEV